MQKNLVTGFLIFLVVVGITMQSNAQRNDSTMVFANPQTPLITADTSSSSNIYGLDILFSNDGFGMGFFFRKEYTRTIQGFASLAISEAKDDNEVEYYDYYGDSYVPGKINRFLVFPFTFGIHYRLFDEEILDNFRPYVGIGVGPALVLSSPYDREFFNSLGHAQAHWTFNAYIGGGAFFGTEKGNIMGLSFGYYIIPVFNGIPSLADPNSNVVSMKKDFGGFFISLNFGSSF